MKTQLHWFSGTKLFTKECRRKFFFALKQVLVSVATTSEVKCKFHFRGSWKLVAVCMESTNSWRNYFYNFSCAGRNGKFLGSCDSVQLLALPFRSVLLGLLTPFLISFSRAMCRLDFSKKYLIRLSLKRNWTNNNRFEPSFQLILTQIKFIRMKYSKKYPTIEW